MGIVRIIKSGKGMTKYKLKMNLEGVVKGANKGVTKGMKEAAKVAQKEIRKRAPVSPSGSHGRKRGYMRDHTTVTAVGGKKPRMEVKSPYYALYVEKGTVNMDAQPFITPVIKGMRRDIISRIAKEGRKETERAIGRRRKR